MSIAQADINTADKEAKVEQLRRRRNHYSQDFKTEAARAVVYDKERLTDVAKKFRVPDQTLMNWVRKERLNAKRKPRVASSPVVHQISSTRDREEIARLNAELESWKERSDTFEKAAKLFASESA